MESKQSTWKQAFLTGLLAGAVALYFTLVGMVKAFSKRAVIADLSLGHITLLLAVGTVLYVYALRDKSPAGQRVMHTTFAGALGGFLLALYPFLGQWVDFHYMFIRTSPELYALLRFGQPPTTGLILMILAGALLGAVLAALTMVEDFWRNAIIRATLITITVGMLSDLFKGMTIGEVFTPFMNAEGLNYVGAVLVFVLTIAYLVFARKRQQQRAALEAAGQKPKEVLPSDIRRWVIAGGLIIVLLALPAILGSYLSHVLNMVGLYVIMGLGLNIVVGYAGLLDLGYVAFFALGAYTMGLLTSTGPLGIAHFTFWEALPFSIMVALIAGILLGIPVLRMRGDYLAIVTLGFGEIIRILALSNWLKPLIGGAQGILLIKKPPFGPWKLTTPIHFYYLILAGIALAFFVAYRLRESRLGRAWMAMREDEDVAEAMGIDLVVTKLTAFAFGASFSGLSGAIFASYVGSIFPHSFNLLISINVLSLIIVGGVGSLPGVVVGSLALVGLPELLREFAEYRMLMYGLALIAMMLLKPEGFWPEPIRKRELRVEETGD